MVQDTQNAVPDKSLNPRTQTYKPGEFIFREGYESDFTYRIVKGEIYLSKLIENEELHLATIGEGKIFGEMGVLDGSPRSACAQAVGEVELEIFDYEMLTSYIMNNPDIALPIMEQLVSNLRTTSDRLAHSQFQNIQNASQNSQETKKRGSLLSRLKIFMNADSDINEFQPDAVEIERRRMPGVAYLMLFTILALIVTVVTFASYAVIDTTVIAQGKLATKSSKIILQPLETAMIRGINVKQGDIVSEGDILATLDPTFVEADIDVSRATLLGLQAQESRLLLELYGGDENKTFSDVPELETLEREVFMRRNLEFNSKLMSRAQKVEQLKASMSANKQNMRDMTEQVEVLREIEAMRTKLLTAGHGSRLNYLGAKNQRLSLEMEQRRLETDLTRQNHELLGANADHEAFVSEWRSSIAQELVNVRRRIDEIKGNLVKSERRSTLVQIVAPADGIVLETPDLTVGSVVQQAQAMFTLVPLNSDLQFETFINPKDVSQVQIGDLVRIKLDALPFQKHGLIEGQITLISEDTVETDIEGVPTAVYSAKVDLTQNNLTDLPDRFRLLPGMTATGEIKVGNRRLITYFIYPIIRTISTSFREP